MFYPFRRIMFMIQHINWKCNLRILGALSSTDGSIPCPVSSGNSSSAASYIIHHTDKNRECTYGWSLLPIYAYPTENSQRATAKDWGSPQWPKMVTRAAYLNAIQFVIRSWSRGYTRHQVCHEGIVWQTADLKSVLLLQDVRRQHQ